MVNESLCATTAEALVTATDNLEIAKKLAEKAKDAVLAAKEKRAKAHRDAGEEDDEEIPPDDETRKHQKATKSSQYKWNMTMTGMDCMRLTRNFAFMSRCLHTKTTDAEILNAGKACLEHHFDNHTHCDSSWCRRKNLLPEERKAKKAFYRNKTRDHELYSELSRIMKRFVTLEALKEIAHSMDTLANESMNNTISWVAPKNKVYCGTASLAIRIAIAVGINSLGTMRFYNELFRLFGITMTDDVAHWLEVKDNNRSKRLTKAKTIDFKKKRKLQFYEKLKEERKLGNTVGIYQSGIGMTGGYADLADDDDQQEEDLAPAKTASSSSKKPKFDPNKRCNRCLEIGHARKTSKLCQYYKARQPKAVVLTPQQRSAIDDADELDEIDAMPLQDVEEASNSSSANSNDFFDARDYCSSEDNAAFGVSDVLGTSASI